MSAEEQRRASTTGDASTRDPQEIRKEIEETRVELGETVSEVAAKADVKKRAQEKADEIKQQAGAGVQQAQRVARENPTPVAVAGAFLAGLALGRMTSR